MTINDAKKILLDRVNIEIEAAELRAEIQAKEKQIKKLNLLVEEAQEDYNRLESSKLKQFFLGLAGKKEERLLEAQNELRKTQGELSTAEYELHSSKDRFQDIEETIKEIESACEACLNTVAEEDGEAMKNKVLAVCELSKLCDEIGSCLSETKQLFMTAYDIYQTRTVAHSRPSVMEGTFNNVHSDMRKHSKLIENAVNAIIQKLNTYNEFAPEEIKIEFHDKWMDKENYWKGQQMAADSLDRIKKVEDWFYRLDNCWKVMRKQQQEMLKKLQESVLEYLDS